MDRRMNICVGKDIEVCSKQAGFLGSYFKGKVTAKVGKNKFEVEYDTLVSNEDEKQKLREIVDKTEIRPCPPDHHQETRVPFEVLDKVDAYDNGGWWVGRVTERAMGNKYYVHFDSTGDELEYEGRCLRLHQEWDNGYWVPSQTRKGVKRRFHVYDQDDQSLRKKRLRFFNF